MHTFKNQNAAKMQQNPKISDNLNDIAWKMEKYAYIQSLSVHSQLIDGVNIWLNLAIFVICACYMQKFRNLAICVICMCNKNKLWFKN